MAIVEPGKYGNSWRMVDGYRFASKAEARRYEELRLMKLGGLIRYLEADKSKLRYPLVVNGLKVCTYEADFRYIDAESGREVVEDVKGFKTPAYTIKRKLMKAIYNVDIAEVDV